MSKCRPIDNATRRYVDMFVFVRDPDPDDDIAAGPRSPAALRV